MNNPENLPHVLEDLKEPVNRYIQDPIAAWIVKFLKGSRVTPNQVTYASIVFGLVSGYVFSHGTALAMVHGGFFLLLTLILDCVDGQLARAKACASNWGRILDGIAGYIAYPAVLLGMILGFPEYRMPLAVIGAVTILKAISYDYCKIGMTTVVQRGYDGNQKEIFDIYQQIKEKSSAVLKMYFYYLQVQQAIFGGRWSSLVHYEEKNRENFDENLLTPEQREQYREKVKTLTAIWRWNGVDFPLFLLAVSAILGILKPCLIPFAWFLTAQYLLTMSYHLLKNKGVV